MNPRPPPFMWYNKMEYIILWPFSFECRKAKSKVITLTITTDADNAINQSAPEANTCSRRQPRETRASKSQLVLVLLLIG